MSRYVFKRLLSFIPMMLLITFISFLIMDLSPVDPVTMYLKPGQEAITQERIEEVRHELGLDQPLVIRYVYWLKEAVQGNLGYSLSTKKPVLTEISSRIGTTVLVQLLTLVVSAVGGIMLGVYSARHRYSFQDTSITVLTFMGISIPNFYLALLMILLFTMKLGWLPSVGLNTVGLVDPTWLEVFWDRVKHLIMPVAVCSMAQITGWTRSQRNMFLDVVNQDYIRTARAKGLDEKTVVWKHAFKNSSLPIITSLGMALPTLISGSFIVETIFAIPGLGSLGTDAIMKNDYPIIMATLMFASFLTLLGPLISDILYVAIDPRIRY